MKIEKHFFKMSVRDTFFFFLVSFITINFFVIGFTIIQGNVRFFFYDGSWILQILLPFIHAIINGAFNRNGVLKVTDIPDFDYAKNKIELLLEQKNLIKTVDDSGLVNYNKRSRFGRFFFYVFREDINVKYSNDDIMIYGKRNSFSTIETKLKFDKKLKNITSGVNSKI